eukprot:jgi/Astpho2/3673/fgenesh1_pg.00060_%23_2_t
MAKAKLCGSVSSDSQESTQPILKRKRNSEDSHAGSLQSLASLASDASSLEAFDRFQSGFLAGPSTADVRELLDSWAGSLRRLQPKCIVIEEVFMRTLRLLERLTAEGAMPAYWDPCSTDQAVVAACFWIATKAEGNRNTVPSRTLLTRAIATVAPSVLINTEMQVMFALRWNVGATEELQG